MPVFKLFAEVLEVVGFLVGSDLDDTITVGVCAYGEQGDLLVLVVAHSLQLFAAVALLSPIGDAPINRLQKAEYPAALFAARTSDEESIKSNVLLWRAHAAGFLLQTGLGFFA